MKSDELSALKEFLSNFVDVWCIRDLHIIMLSICDGRLLYIVLNSVITVRNARVKACGI
jgi:hypothetical protein